MRNVAYGLGLLALALTVGGAAGYCLLAFRGGL